MIFPYETKFQRNTVTSIFLFTARTIHASATVFALRTHKLFQKVDWERVDAGNYAVVDPVNPRVILYLSEQDYIVMVRVAITSNRTLKVLAVPGDTPDPDSSQPKTDQKSPHSQWDEVLNFGRQTSKGSRGRQRLLQMWRSQLQPFFAKRKLSSSTKVGVESISMVKLTVGNVCEWFHSWYQLVSWWSRGSNYTTVRLSREQGSFARHLQTVLKSNGTNNLIARLKIMLFVVNAFLGGRRLDSTEELGFRVSLSHGLPRHIPKYVRDGIRKGHKHYIHIWTSILFAYKGILGTWEEPELAKGTICSPHPNIHQSPLYLDFIEFNRKLWLKLFEELKLKSPDLSIKTPFFSIHAGPNHPMSILGAGIDAYLWASVDHVSDWNVGTEAPTQEELMAQPDIMRQDKIVELAGVSRNYIREWLEATGQGALYRNIEHTARWWGREAEQYFSAKKEFESTTLISKEERKALRKTFFQFLSSTFGYNIKSCRLTHPTLQRLHNLYEAAGKVRTIAIVDYWTNFVLKPLHDWMFDLLKLLPQDATFDQEGRVREFAGRGYTDVYSYDLKSATDLIPLALYGALFKWVLPEKVMFLWFDLLVSRNFSVPSVTLKAYPSHPKRIRYTTGQPMGALTSWASMALVHHALVLYSAYKAKVVTLENILSFLDYMVLGDDVVIANALVAQEYVRTMTDLGIKLSLNKSHISAIGMFNFANQTFVKDMNVSPASMREEINANSLPERAEQALRLARRGWMDLQSRTWLTPLVKKMLRPDIYAHIVPSVKGRRVHPVVRWILSVILTPGTTRFGFAGLGNVALETFLGAQLRKGDLWQSRMSRLSDFVRVRSEGLLISLLGKWSNAVYSEFLRSRKRLEEFPTWLSRVVSIDLEWLFMRLFMDAKDKALKRWVDKYRIPLKTVQVSTNMSKFNMAHVEIGADMKFDDMVELVRLAEAELPAIPDFSQDNLEALVGLGFGEMGAMKQTRAARESFLRVTSLLGMIDHLDVHRTPGSFEAWDKSQSSESTNVETEK